MDRWDFDGYEWAARSEYWSCRARISPGKMRNKRRDRRPLTICGHGASLQIDRNTLLARSGFTHYPQQREEFRYFCGDPNLPSRIIVIGASGSISFDALAWLAEQKIPLIQINWQGSVIGIANANYSADPKLVAAQRRLSETDAALKKFRRLIVEKFKNSISTLDILPKGSAKCQAIEFLNASISQLNSGKPISDDKLLGIEGQCGALYFAAWRGIPIKWKSLRRKIIPADWRCVGVRRSAISKSNRNARHPVNAMLNYSYAVLHGHTKMQIIAEGRDPTIGLSHASGKYRDALVLDRMEPLRPIVDRVVLHLVVGETFSASDFSITNQGHCRLNPQLARSLAKSISEELIGAV